MSDGVGIPPLIQLGTSLGTIRNKLGVVEHFFTIHFCHTQKEINVNLTSQDPTIMTAFLAFLP